ncbi:NAD-dependent epimerase/dehydratase family protein [Planctomicrobium sp. SH668]|uniref:NAD-dependent epimerase/dehydratase family protein n=1 Tax=Planctomicrobium sp. SH668 TaxID=3448126 RepID=UPI003F5B2967
MSVTALVTGGTGFLGRRLIKLLVDRDVNVRCLVRESSDLSAVTSGLTQSQLERIRFVTGDLENRSSIEPALENVDVVYHLAAALNGSCSTMFLNTVIPTRGLMEAAADAQVGRFVLVSSMGVYGTATVKRWQTLDESTPVDPSPEERDAYSFSKVRQEQIAWQIREKRGLPLVVVRPGVIYGPGRSLLTSRVGLSLGPFFIRMGGGQLLPYTHVENCASAIMEAGLTPGIEGEVFNVVDDDLPTGKRILRLLRKNGKHVRSFWIPRRAITPLASIYAAYSKWSEGQLPAVLSWHKSEAIWKPLRYSNEKAKTYLNWMPNISTEAGLQQAIDQQ